MMLAGDSEPESSEAGEERDDQDEADKSPTGWQRAGMEQGRQAFKAAHFARWKLLDQLRDDERADRQQHHHRRTDHRKADQVPGEVRNPVEGDRRVS